LTGVGLGDPVPEGGGEKRPADDVVDADLADDGGVLAGELDEEPPACLGFGRLVEAIEGFVVDGASATGESRLPRFEPVGRILANAEVLGFVTSGGKDELDARGWG
jgi:hypothetical protein